MQKLERYLPLLYALVEGIVFAILLQDVQQFVFYYREQQQILAWDWDLICQRYLCVAGPALFKAHVLTQFFYQPWVGSVTTAILAVVAALCLWCAVKPLTRQNWAFPICLVPYIFEISNLSDQNYQYQGFICLVILSIFMAIYGWISQRLSLCFRLVASLGMTLLLFFMAGPVCTLFGIYAVLIDVFTKREKSYFQLASVLVALLAQYYALRWCWLPSVSKTFTQDLFYYYLLPLPESCKYSWIALVAVPVIVFLTSRIHLPKLAGRVFIGLLLILGVGFFSYSISQSDKQKQDILVEFQHYVTVEDWDAIIRHPAAHSRNYLIMNYVNLALSKKGIMLSHFFDYEQPDPQTLVVFHEADDNKAELTFIYAHVNYQMGDMGGAQNHAHDTYVLTHYGHPAMLQMLIKTNLIKGAYEVADKYITLLEKSWRYHDWAMNMRKMLYNDKAIEADADLGRMRKSLPSDDTFTLDPEICLYKTLEVNPNDKAARDYLIAYLFIYRDQDDINRFVETFYQTPVLNPFPQELQEAFLLVNDVAFDYCREHGVSEENIERYKNFMMAFDRADRSGQNPMAALRKEFGNTTWYNFMFK